MNLRFIILVLKLSQSEWTHENFDASKRKIKDYFSSSYNLVSLVFFGTLYFLYTIILTMSIIYCGISISCWKNSIINYLYDYILIFNVLDIFVNYSNYYSYFKNYLNEFIISFAVLYTAFRFHT